MAIFPKLALGDFRNPDAFCALVQFQPDPWQRELLHAEDRRIILNCSRQAGKSTTAALLALHRSLSRPKHLTLMLSPSLRQSGELFQKVSEWIEQLPQRPKTVEATKHRITFPNGSRIVSLPASGATIRGFSAVNLLLEDESAYVDDKLNSTVLPMLAVSRGQLVLMSSPGGTHGHFYEAWERGADWRRFRVPATDVSRIPKEDLERFRVEKGEALFRQEFLCEFLNANTGLVYGSYRPALHVIDAPAAPGGAKRYTTNHVLGIDFGVTSASAFSVLGWRENDPRVFILESFKEEGLSPSSAARIIEGLEREYQPHKIVGDIGGLGKGFQAEARERFRLPIEAAQKANKLGYISLFNDALADGRLFLLRDTTKPLQDEWQHLVWHENGQKELPGLANHCADATLYAWRECKGHLETAAPAALSHDNAMRAYYEEETRKMKEWAFENARSAKRERDEALADNPFAIVTWGRDNW